MPILRDYQKKAIELIEAENGNVCLQMATGSGKTVVFTELAKRHYAENITPVLILVHRKELLKQAFNKLGERCFIVEAGTTHIPHDYSYYVGMVESVNKRLNKLPLFGLVIIDECHFANFRKMPFFSMPETKVVGVTATPIAEKPLSDLFKTLIQPIDIKHLIEQNYLVNSKAYGFASDLVSAQKFKVKGGEFDEHQMEEFYTSEKMIKNVIEAYWDYCAGLKTIIFNVNIEHNIRVYHALGLEGLPVFYVDSTISDIERQTAIEGFKNTKNAIMCNVGILTTGFDEPSIQAVVLNRATKSLALYLQMLGRGSRPYENKNEFIVIDLGKNTARHGMYDDFFDWQAFFKKGTKKESKGEGAMPIKECPKCGFMQNSRKVICENCGHNFADEAERQKKEEKIQKLVELTRNNPINVPTDRLFDLAKEKNWNMYAVLHRIAEHVVKYELKHKGIVEPENSEQMAFIELQKWCKHYGKRFDSWNKEFLIKSINEKRKQNSAGNSNLVQKQQPNNEQYPF